jgi:hypothetical protein
VISLRTIVLVLASSTVKMVSKSTKGNGNLTTLSEKEPDTTETSITRDNSSMGQEVVLANLSI